MRLVTALLAAILLNACAAVGAPIDDINNLPLRKFTHADLQTAAAYATANGYPARAAFWTAVEGQLTACEQALAAVAPKPAPNGTVGVATLFEMGAEAVGQGIPANVKINCSFITLPGL